MLNMGMNYCEDSRAPANLRGLQFGVLNTKIVLASTNRHADKVSASSHPHSVKDVVPCTPKGRLAVPEFKSGVVSHTKGARAASLTSRG
jgi:hypothetical protein